MIGKKPDAIILHLDENSKLAREDEEGVAWSTEVEHSLPEDTFHG